ncbi:hypothetical protein M431DRAFT_369588 [Trichoderma harzianum CBS 226.95]|uniref:Uncharacterized protein n=1 Tax=Trichoderma harzianum CBS 226.95 TaxID=983964 RepID=A0A2T3ZS35_TRIHA|nr:hypothetical protein M431DRAFT_369588 [Trichoderma harzianum CBS 226.95]PTB47627.1 hypothetical protein M431DRAFT_369588 [Trichoderma harzianum CBS 226.95]
MTIFSICLLPAFVIIPASLFTPKHSIHRRSRPSSRVSARIGLALQLPLSSREAIPFNTTSSNGHGFPPSHSPQSRPKIHRPQCTPSPQGAWQRHCLA